MAKLPISDFEFPKSAKFYKIKKRIPETLIKSTMREISKIKVGQYLHDEYKKTIDTENGNSALISSFCFKIKTKPNFIKNNSILEHKYCFIVFVEFDNYLAILKKNCSDPFKLLKEHLEVFTSSEVSGYINDSPDTCCEKLSVSTMSIGSYDIYGKSFEAYNLIDSLPNFNSHRLIPRNARFSETRASYSISVGSAKITESADKDEVDGIVDWCFDFKSRIERKTVPQFMEQFSSSIALQDLPTTVKPQGVLINIGRLKSFLEGDLELRYKNEKMSKFRRKRLFRHARKVIDVGGANGNKYKLSDSVLTLVKNSNTYALRSNFLREYSIRNTSSGVEDSLTSYINIKGLFNISFSDLSYFYTNKKLYRDNNMINNVKYIVSIYEGVDSFKAAKTEKGEKYISSSSTNFPIHSLFYRVWDYYKKKSDFIVCDDLGSKEWADHFVFRKAKSGAPMISLVHSKGKPNDSHGASEMQEVIGQAVKNLGKVNLTSADVSEKRSLWTTLYKPSVRGRAGLTSNIPRIMGNYHSYEHFIKNVIDINASPHCVREVVLAVNFVSKKEISKLVSKARNNTLSSHQIQLLWLMSSFISSCIEVGVRPRVLCQE